MSSENSVLQENELQSTTILNDILDKMNHMPNMVHVVNSITHLNDICVPMIGAKSLLTGYNEQSNGITGFVPAPDVTESGKFLRGDGTWQTVITSIDPLRTEEMITDTSVKDTQAYPYLQPSSDTSGTVGSLKYNTNLSFGRRYANFGTNTYKEYTTLEIKSDGNDCVDNAIIFKSATAGGKSSTLLANIESLKNNVYVKMPTTSGMILTDSGFIANGNSTFTKGVDINNSSLTFSVAELGNTSSLNWQISADTTYLRLKYNSNTNGGLTSEEFATFYTGASSYGKTLTLANSNLSAKSIIVNGGTSSNYYRISKNANENVKHVTYGTDLEFETRDANYNLMASVSLSASTTRIATVNTDYLSITPLSYSGGSYTEGGEIVLAARTGNTYGDIHIDNYGGQCRIFNSKYLNNIISISPSNYTITTVGYNLNASNLSAVSAVTANVVTSNSGQVNFSSDGKINLKVHSDGENHIDSTVPISTSADTPVGDAGKRYYRPIIVSNAAPSSNTVGKNGDVWIQYS